MFLQAAPDRAPQTELASSGRRDFFDLPELLRAAPEWTGTGAAIHVRPGHFGVGAVESIEFGDSEPLASARDP